MYIKVASKPRTGRLLITPRHLLKAAAEAQLAVAGGCAVERAAASATEEEKTKHSLK